MSAKEIRKAATTLRTLSEDATRGRWAASDEYVLAGRVVVAITRKSAAESPDFDQRDKDARHIAALDPEVSDALADLLDAIAKRTEEISDAMPTVEFGERVAAGNVPGYSEALAVVRLVNRTAGVTE